MGPDADDPNARFKLVVWSTGGSDEMRVWLRLSHTLLPEPSREKPSFQVDISSGVLRKDCNELSIWCDADATETEKPIIVHQVFVSVNYGREDNAC